MAPTVNLSGISSQIAELVVLSCFLIASACILQFIISKINEKIPISIIWFLYGMLTYGIALQLNQWTKDPLSRAILHIRHIDNSVLYYIVLPILLYEATQEINWYAFKNFIIGGISLAILGVFLQVFLLGILFHYTIIGSDKIGISISFIIASIISSTDPIAVLAVLNGVSAPPRLSSIFNAESLINDGSSVLLFQFFYLLSVGDSGTVGYYVILFFKLLFLSPLMGVIMGILVSLWISIFHSHHYAQCVSLMIGGYISYFLAEYILNISGPLTIVCYGIFIKALGIIGLDRDAHDIHKHFMHGLSFIANSVVFMISGVITLGMVASTISNNTAFTHISKLLAMYFYLNIARIIMISIFMPLLHYIGYGITWKELILLVWGGLRGSMVLVLALRIERDPNFTRDVTSMIAFYISGSAFLILMLQGFTFELLYKLLNPYKINPFRKVYLEKVMKIINYYYINDMRNLNSYWLFKGTDVVHLANELVPKLTSMKWSVHGLLHLDMPSVNHVMGEILSEEIGFSHTFYHPEKSFVQNIFKNEENMQDDDIDDGYISLFTQGLLVKQDAIGVRFNPKLNLRLLERATTSELDKEQRQYRNDLSQGNLMRHPSDVILHPNDMMRSSELRNSEWIRSNDFILHPNDMMRSSDLRYQDISRQSGEFMHPGEIIRRPSDISRQSSGISRQNSGISRQNSDIMRQDSGILRQDSIEGAFPDRQSTDVTIVFDRNTCNVGKNHHTYTNPMTINILNKSCLTPVLSLNSDLDEDEDELPNFKFDKNVLRKEREGELYIMVFNACKQMYKTLYNDGYIGGGTLLSLESVLDISCDFALKKLKYKSIKAWNNALKDCNESYFQIHNWLPHSNDIHSMDGFEFEWLALKRILSSNFSKRNIKHSHNDDYVNDNNKISLFTRIKSNVKYYIYKIYSFIMSFISRIKIAKYELEMLIAFVDSHQRILMVGGPNFENLVGKELLSSYIKQMKSARLYLRILIKKYPKDIKLELIRIAAFMLIRIKSSIVKNQVENGLLLSEDSDRILSLLFQQCYDISRYSVGLFTFTLKSFSLRNIREKIYSIFKQ